MAPFGRRKKVPPGPACARRRSAVAAVSINFHLMKKKTLDREPLRSFLWPVRSRRKVLRKVQKRSPGRRARSSRKREKTRAEDPMPLNCFYYRRVVSLFLVSH